MIEGFCDVPDMDYSGDVPDTLKKAKPRLLCLQAGLIKCGSYRDVLYPTPYVSV